MVKLWQNWKIFILIGFVSVLTLEINALTIDGSLPPLAYTSWANDWETYELYDFSALSSTLVDRGEYRLTFGVWNGGTSPEEYLFSPPSAPDTRLAVRTNAENARLYDLYELSETEERLLVERIDNVLFVRFDAYWSSDNRYAYFTIRLDDDREVFAQYDFHTDSVHIKEDMRIRRCQLGFGCILLEALDEDNTSFSMFHLSVDTGDMTHITETNSITIFVYYERSLNQMSIGYNSSQSILILDMETLEVTWQRTLGDSRFTQWKLSPDGTSIAIMVEATNIPDIGYVSLIDIASDTATITIEGYTREAPSGDLIQHEFQWLPNNRLAFIASHEEYLDFYVITLDDGIVHSPQTYQETIFDQAWSPDGNWLAYIYEEQLYVTAWDGSTESQRIGGDEPINCVAWLPAEDYTPNILICDKYWGVG
ncbi:MAG: DPP IV N-terminal domain-containing protein [Chloroflexota bacterium]